MPDWDLDDLAPLDFEAPLPDPSAGLGVGTDAVEHPVEPDEPPSVAVQLRFDLPQPRTPVTIGVTLRGLTVVAAPWEGDTADAVAYLHAARISARVDPDRGITFPVAELGRLADLPEQVQVEPLGDIVPLVRYALADATAPATVTGNDPMRLCWWDGSGRREAELSAPAAAALGPSRLPFVAAEESWSELSRTGDPVVLGEARMNLDGFIELSTTRPQQLEAAPLPGLFRIGPVHFGVSAAYYDDVVALDGVGWVGPRPRPDRPVAVPAGLDGMLSEHVEYDLRVLLDRLALLRGQVLVYRPGLGRRVLAVAALESLGSFPALVVCPPWTIWVWQRVCDLLARSVSLTGADADVRLITYLDLSLRPRLEAFEAIVFDDITGEDASSDRARSAISGLAVMDAYRIGISSRWPEDPEEACAALEAVRPGEFTLGSQALVQRYPLRPVVRAEEHAAPYLLRRDHVDVPATLGGPPRRSEVLCVPASPEQLRAARDSTTTPPRRRLADACELASSGTATAVSPKIAAAFTMVADAVAARRRIVVATRSRRSATLLRATLASFQPATVDERFDASRAGAVSVCLWARRLPDLRAVDEVVLVDYPWSNAAIDDAVGAAELPEGPKMVTLLHSPGLVDDRLAVYAARRRELGAADDPAEPPSDADIEHLLARRWE